MTLALTPPLSLRSPPQDLVVLPSRTNLSSALALTLARCVTSTRGPISSLKAVKNATEVQGFRDCHVRDGVALVRYFAWLENELARGEGELREFEAASKLEEFRRCVSAFPAPSLKGEGPDVDGTDAAALPPSPRLDRELPHFRGLSFSTISSTGANASVIHYSPPSDGTSAVIDPSKIYLCDSGAQFTDGTTECVPPLSLPTLCPSIRRKLTASIPHSVTRTLHFGEPTAFEKRAYTRVLQGHIAIDAAVFPETTTGYMLDPWARKALWQDGLGAPPPPSFAAPSPSPSDD